MGTVEEHEIKTDAGSISLLIDGHESGGHLRVRVFIGIGRSRGLAGELCIRQDELRIIHALLRKGTMDETVDVPVADLAKAVGLTLIAPYPDDQVEVAVDWIDQALKVKRDGRWSPPIGQIKAHQ